MTHATPQARPATEIDGVANAHFARLLDLSPEFATSLGLPGRETLYSDYSPAGREARAAEARATLADLEGLEPRDATDSVTLDAMRERLGLELEIEATGITELNNIASAPQDIRAVFDLMPTQTPEHWEHIAGRLANVPAALEGYTASLEESIGRGLPPAARQVRIVAGQTAEYARPEGFFGRLVDGAPAGLPGALPAALAANARAAAEAYGRFSRHLADSVLPRASARDAAGRDLYALMSRRFLGAAVDLEETYRWGLGELERLVAEQHAVADGIRPGATLGEAKAVLDADPARQLKGTAALRDWMQEKSDAAIAALAGTHFDIPSPMDRLECLIAPTQEGGIYYTGPSDDFSRAGRMWWSVPAGEDEFTTWAETTTVYHEGVPGHHLQIATATYLRDSLNDWRRHACWVSGHGEGWALYAERLMLDLGFLADPGDHLGMLDMQRMRAARVVFDIGVHLGLPAPEDCGGGTWTPEQGRAFLERHLAISPGQLDFEFNRYLGWPGQAPAYKVGQRLWEEIRDACRAAEGPAFDLRAFHGRALALGSVGLDTLRRALLPAAG